MAVTAPSSKQKCRYASKQKCRYACGRYMAASVGSGSGRPERYGFAKQWFRTRALQRALEFWPVRGRASDESGSGRPERYNCTVLQSSCSEPGCYSALWNFGRSGSGASDGSKSGRPERFGFAKQLFRTWVLWRTLQFWPVREWGV